MSNTMINLGLVFDNSYADELEGFYAFSQADKAPSAALVSLNLPLAAQLGITNTDETELAHVFSG
ncbi:hypothetical protein N9W21_00955, partial [Shewanella sp.]|nr:hypothetical protein [Shewanella sp.]